MSERMKGKVVVVTGAAQGIGFGCAKLLAAEGAKVVLGDRQRGKGEEAAEKIRQEGGEAIFRGADVTSEKECELLMEAAVTTHGRLDGLVNNAGWFPRATLEETTAELWDQVLQVNLRGAFYCCKHAVPRMKREKGGSIVNMGSICGLQSLPNLVAYGAAKGGLLTLTRTLAGAFAKDKIRVNYLVPGWVFTEGELALHRAEGRDAEEMRKQGERLPLGRPQTPLDAAYAAVYLLSDESAQVTGTILNVDAGAATLPLPQGFYPG
jgi:NAD(P)-dependent dehydrogenase (short-subunit alcohol dehydrogenase family)